MFAEDTFASLTFADLFLVPGQVSYTFRRGRTVVVAIIPGNGTIITEPQPRIIRTKVEVDKTITTLNPPDRILRTKVETDRSRTIVPS